MKNFKFVKHAVYASNIILLLAVAQAMSIDIPTIRGNFRKLFAKALWSEVDFRTAENYLKELDQQNPGLASIYRADVEIKRKAQGGTPSPARGENEAERRAKEEERKKQGEADRKKREQEEAQLKQKLEQDKQAREAQRNQEAQERAKREKELKEAKTEAELRAALDKAVAGINKEAAEKAQLRAEIDKLRNELLAANNAVSRTKDLELQVAALTSQVQALRLTQPENKQELVKTLAEAEAAKQLLQPMEAKCDELRRANLTLRTECDQLKNKCRQLEASCENYRGQIDNLKDAASKDE